MMDNGGMKLTESSSLKRFPMFHEFTAAELSRLGEIVRIVEAGHGATLFREGERCRGFYLVQTGKVRVYRIGDDGKVHTIHIVGPGGTFAEVSIFLDSGYPAFAETLEDAILYFVPRDRFLALISSDAELCLKILRNMAGWIRRLLGMVENLSAESAEERVGRYLLSLASAGVDRRTAKVRLPAKKYVVASHLGITPEAFSRALASLKRRRAIHVARDGVITLIPSSHDHRDS